MSWISIDVDIDDIISAMSSYERRRFFQAMQDDGYVSKLCVITSNGEVQAPTHVEKNALNESRDEFNQALQTLFGNGWKLTLEQEQYIINLAKRF